MAETPSFTFRTVNGIRLHVVEAGPEDGPLVILLHGFPEFWYGWRHQIGPLAEAGFRVVCPDQRGYNTSDKPKAIAAYDLETLATDVIGLIDSAGREKAMLVGHDWGGVVAWWTAQRFPDRLERLAILNAPHPLAFRRFVLRHPGQMLRSRYILGFQIPTLPEARLSRANWAALVDALRSSSRPGTFSDEDLARYREAWSEPGAITAMLHWYRALRSTLFRSPEPTRIKLPTLLIWGARDRFLDRRLVALSLEHCESGRLELIEEATHWVQHEEPDRVNKSLSQFLR